jgi:flagellar hook-associated protein 1 FlgK
MSDLLSTGVSGLLAFQTALETISNNISNVNTPGYDQETANLVTNPATAAAQGWIGNGVTVGSVSRSYNQFLAQQANSATSGYNQLNTLTSFANQINNMFSDPGSGLSATLQAFSSSLQTLANSPSQSATRQAVLTQAQALISQFQSYSSNLSQLQAQVNGQLNSEASAISSLGQSIANLNQQIIQAQSNGTGQPPNQLLDQRDQLINQLSQHVGVNTVTESNGAIDVFIGSGQPLVVGTNAATLSAGPDAFKSGQLQLSFQGASGNVDVTKSLTGGTLGGLLQFQEQMLTPGVNTLGQAAVTLTNLVNAQNQAGLDLSGAIGQSLLAVGGPRVTPSTLNGGSATVTAAITNVAGLTTSNYYLKYDGSNWTLVDPASGTSTALSASSSGGATTLTGGGGLTLTVTGSAHAGDEYLVEPTSNAVAGLRLLTTDPTKIAAAAPLLAGAATGNTGSAAIQNASVPNTALWTRGNYQITFSSATNYTVTGAGGPVTSGSYTSGTPIVFNGISVTLTGTPSAGDSFAINDNAGGIGDNRNALLLANIINQKALNGGSASLSDAAQSYVGTVGIQTSQAQNGATAQQSVMSGAQSAQQSVSGVNLDQEAAHMLQYQQAYEAAAQLIQVSHLLFNSLLGAVQGAPVAG